MREVADGCSVKHRLFFAAVAVLGLDLCLAVSFRLVAFTDRTEQGFTYEVETRTITVEDTASFQDWFASNYMNPGVGHLLAAWHMIYLYPWGYGETWLRTTEVDDQNLIDRLTGLAAEKALPADSRLLFFSQSLD